MDERMSGWVGGWTHACMPGRCHDCMPCGETFNGATRGAGVMHVKMHEIVQHVVPGEAMGARRGDGLLTYTCWR
eukprot:359009-Chlamydomonas_euryale.AAC.8